MNVKVEDLGLRERKKERTRAALEEAALRLFDQKGVEATTVEEISAEAEVSPRTFFRYFGAKEDVLLSEDEAGWFRKALEERSPGDSALDVLRAAFAELAADFESNRERNLRRFRLSRSSPSLAARVAQRRRKQEDILVEALTAEGAEEFDVRVEVAAAFAALRVCIDKWLEEGGAGNLPAMATEVLDRLSRGFDSRPD